MPRQYCPDRGDVVWLTFTPQTGHEQRGRRPALVLSAKRYNRKAGLAVFCPITSSIKGYPFEVPLPEGLGVSGAVLSDQVKSLDWRARRADRLGKVPAATLGEVLDKPAALLFQRSNFSDVNR